MTATTPTTTTLSSSPQAQSISWSNDTWINASTTIGRNSTSIACIYGFLDSETYLSPYLRWLVPVLVLAGVVGNGFILVVFNSKGMRTKTHFILSAMAAVDLAHALVAMLTNLYLYERWIDSDWFSSFYHHRMKPPLMVMVNWLAMTSTWLAVLCTIERFIAIRHPLRAHLMIRKRIIALSTFGIAAASLVVCSYYAFWFRRVSAVSCENPSRMLYRLVPDRNLWVYGHLSRQIHSLLCSLIPIALLFYYNGALVNTLRRNRDPRLHKINDHRRRERSTIKKKMSTSRFRRGGAAGAGGQDDDTNGGGNVVSFEDAREKKVALVVLAITLTTAFLLLPSALIVVYDVGRWVRHAVTGVPNITPWWFLTASDLSNSLVLLEKVLDFFLYCFASGSFRRRLVAMCGSSRLLSRGGGGGTFAAGGGGGGYPTGGGGTSFLSSPRHRGTSTSSIHHTRRLAKLSSGTNGIGADAHWANALKYHSLLSSSSANNNNGRHHQHQCPIESNPPTTMTMETGLGSRKRRLSTSISDSSSEKTVQKSSAIEAVEMSMTVGL